MWCSSSRPMPLQLHSVVYPPLTSLSKGRIVCRVIGEDPIHFDWTGPEEVQTDASGSEAYGVTVGRYKVVAHDNDSRRAEMSMDVEATMHSATVVSSYNVTAATTRLSRDGAV